MMHPYGVRYEFDFNLQEKIAPRFSASSSILMESSSISSNTP